MPTKIEYARLAAYIDGEGCIDIHKHTQYRPHLKRNYSNWYIRITMTNTKPELSAWCEEIFGGCDYEEKRDHPDWNNSKKWYVQARKATDILRHCLPYFLLKHRQAELAIRFQQTVDTAHKTGRRGLPPQVLQGRQEMVKEMHRLNRRGKPKIDHS